MIAFVLRSGKKFEILPSWPMDSFDCALVKDHRSVWFPLSTSVAVYLKLFQVQYARQSQSNVRKSNSIELNPWTTGIQPFLFGSNQHGRNTKWSHKRLSPTIWPLFGEFRILYTSIQFFYWSS